MSRLARVALIFLGSAAIGVACAVLIGPSVVGAVVAAVLAGGFAAVVTWRRGGAA
jgi:hypothetical protein